MILLHITINGVVYIFRDIKKAANYTCNENQNYFEIRG